MPQRNLSLQYSYKYPEVVNITCDTSGDIVLKPATGDQSVLINNLILNGCDTSGCPTATIAADVSGNINLTPASGASTNINGLAISGVSSGIYTLCPSASSNMTIGSTSGYLQSLNLYSTGNIDLQSPTIGLYGGISLNSLQVNTSTSPTISTASTSDLYIGGSTTGNTTCTNIGICSTDTVSLNYLQVNAESSPTIQPSTSTDSITVSASSINFTPSCGYLQMSQTPFYYNNGTGQSMTLPASGVYILSMAANDNSYADCLTAPEYTDSWMVFSTGSSTTAYPYSTEAAGTSSYSGFNGAANDIIGITTSSSANTISIQIDNSAGYFY